MHITHIAELAQTHVTNVPMIFQVLDLIGVFANAILGGILARSAKLDLIGFATLAVLSGLGGGIIRDTLMQQGPPVAFTDTTYIATALAGTALVYVVSVQGKWWENSFQWIDALALGTWCAAGAYKAISLGFPWLPAIFLGTITAVGGGFSRDIVLRRIPSVLGGNTLYATCAMLGSAVMVAFYQFNQPVIGMFLAASLAAALSVIARYRNWMLPAETDWTIGLGDYDQRVRLFLHRIRQKTKRDRGTDDDGPASEVSPSV